MNIQKGLCHSPDPATICPALSNYNTLCKQQAIHAGIGQDQLILQRAHSMLHIS